MAAFHFGTRERRLFGFYDPAGPSVGAAKAVLLCHPFGNEQVFAYRTMRQLATRLMREGSHVLRFDYFGTGDSYGETGEGDLPGWCRDVETAIEELKDLSGADAVNLVGLRLGANLSAQVASSVANGISKVVLWDPLSPAEITATMQKFAVARSGAAEVKSDTFFLASTLPAVNTLVLCTARRPEPLAFGPLQVEYVAQASPWIEESFNAGSTPTKALQSIVDWLR